MTACSATLTTFEPVISATVTPRSAAAARSMWSEPTPAVRMRRSFGATAIRARVT